jgi:hypothetical protein
VKLDTGMHRAWIAGRSQGFGIDYIIIYRTGKMWYDAEHGKGISSPEARKVELAPSAPEYTGQGVEFFPLHPRARIPGQLRSGACDAVYRIDGRRMKMDYAHFPPSSGLFIRIPDDIRHRFEPLLFILE